MKQNRTGAWGGQNQAELHVHKMRMTGKSVGKCVLFDSNTKGNQSETGLPKARKTTALTLFKIEVPGDNQPSICAAGSNTCKGKQ